MKKILLIVLLFITAAYSQNLQLHYDLGEGREYITTTIEMFKPDEYGATFFFIDFDYDLEGLDGNKGISLAYFEFARYLTVYEKLAVTLQYNDGIGVLNPQTAFSLNQTILAGVNYPIDLGFVTLNTDLLYRAMAGSNSPDGQLTIVWFVPLFEGRVNFTGFLDLWTQDEILKTENANKKIVLLTEPQIWYNLMSHLAVGTEIEISNNFLPQSDDIEVNPTIALKWTF